MIHEFEHKHRTTRERGASNRTGRDGKRRGKNRGKLEKIRVGKRIVSVKGRHVKGRPDVDQRYRNAK
jgi:hypothetical protein